MFIAESVFRERGEIFLSQGVRASSDYRNLYIDMNQVIDADIFKKLKGVKGFPCNNIHICGKPRASSVMATFFEFMSTRTGQSMQLSFYNSPFNINELKELSENLLTAGLRGRFSMMQLELQGDPSLVSTPSESTFNFYKFLIKFSSDFAYQARPFHYPILKELEIANEDFIGFCSLPDNDLFILSNFLAHNEELLAFQSIIESKPTLDKRKKPEAVIMETDRQGAFSRKRARHSLGEPSSPPSSFSSLSSSPLSSSSSSSLFVPEFPQGIWWGEASYEKRVPGGSEDVHRVSLAELSVGDMLDSGLALPESELRSISKSYVADMFNKIPLRISMRKYHATAYERAIVGIFFKSALSPDIFYNIMRFLFLPDRILSGLHFWNTLETKTKSMPQVPLSILAEKTMLAETKRVSDLAAVDPARRTKFFICGERCNAPLHGSPIENGLSLTFPAPVIGGLRIKPLVLVLDAKLLENRSVFIDRSNLRRVTVGYFIRKLLTPFLSKQHAYISIQLLNFVPRETRRVVSFEHGEFDMAGVMSCRARIILEELHDYFNKLNFSFSKVLGLDLQSSRLIHSSTPYTAYYEFLRRISAEHLSGGVLRLHDVSINREFIEYVLGIMKDPKELGVVETSGGLSELKGPTVSLSQLSIRNIELIDDVAYGVMLGCKMHVRFFVEKQVQSLVNVCVVKNTIASNNTRSGYRREPYSFTQALLESFEELYALAPYSSLKTLHVPSSVLLQERQRLWLMRVLQKSSVHSLHIERRPFTRQEFLWFLQYVSMIIELPRLSIRLNLIDQCRFFISHAFNGMVETSAPSVNKMSYRPMIWVPGCGSFAGNFLCLLVGANIRSRKESLEATVAKYAVSFVKAHGLLKYLLEMKSIDKIIQPIQIRTAENETTQLAYCFVLNDFIIKSGFFYKGTWQTVLSQCPQPFAGSENTGQEVMRAFSGIEELIAYLIAGGYLENKPEALQCFYTSAVQGGIIPCFSGIREVMLTPEQNATPQAQFVAPQVPLVANACSSSLSSSFYVSSSSSSSCASSSSSFFSQLSSWSASAVPGASFFSRPSPQ